jgi:hypothetical protein
MATAKKSQPLTLEELLAAQYQMLTDPKLTEGQRSAAEQQIEKLEQIQKSLTLANIDNVRENSDTREITKAKGSGQNVSLGDVRTELQGLRKDLTTRGTAPAQDRQPLPRLRLVPGGEGAPADLPREEAGAESQIDRESRLRKIGSIIEQKTEIAKGGSRNETLNTRNAQTFDRFIAESGKKEELLADADEKQLEIFKRIEDTLIKLREAGSDESEALRKELAGISGELEQTGNTKAKEKLTPMLANLRSTARGDVSGRSGNLGDVFGALTGKREVLKEGFTRDDRTGRVHQLRPDGKVGKMVKADEARQGRLGGAATILKSFVGNKLEQFYEGQRSPAIQGFLDRNIRSESNAEQVANLQGQQDMLLKGDATARPVPQRTRPELTVIPGGKGAAKAGSNSLKAQVINITGNVVNIRGNKISDGTAPAPGPAFDGSGSAEGTKKRTEEARAEPKEEKGSLLDTALEAGGGLLSGAGKFLGKAGGKILSGGKMLAGGVKGALGTAGGATLATGAAMVATPFLADAALGAFGVGKDKEGKDLVIDEKQDDANWKRASLFEKIQSAPARGIEKIGGLFGGNIANEARSKRIAQETQYLDNKDGAKTPAQPTATPASAVATAKTEEKQPEKTKKKEAGPNWKEQLKSYEENFTPVDNFERTHPGIKKKFMELAKKELPRTDNMQSIEIHEKQLAYKAQAIMEGKWQEKPTKAEGKAAASGKGKDDVFSAKAINAEYDAIEKEMDDDEATPAKGGETRPAAAGQSPTAERKSRPPSKAENLRETARKMGIDPNKAQGQFEGGVLTKITDTSTGTEHNVEVAEGDRRNVEAARQMRAMMENSGRLAAEASKKHNIGELSRDNKEQSQTPSAPVIINNNNSTSGNTAAPPASMPRGGVRPSESAMEKYANRTSHFW